MGCWCSRFAALYCPLITHAKQALLCYTFFMHCKIRLLSISFLFLIAVAVSADPFPESLRWSFSGSVLFIPEDNGLESDPMPVLAVPGVSAAYPLSESVALEAALDLYGTYYGYSYSLERAVPFAIENRSSFVLGSVFGMQAVYKLSFKDDITIRVYGGPAFDLRLCLIAGGLEGEDREDAAEQTADISRYFWSGGRFFLPVLGSGLDFVSTEHFVVGVDGRIWIPVYKLWTNEDLPAVEGWRAALGIRFSLR